MENWSHFDESGNAVMVDVSGKEVTVRRAFAAGSIRVNQEIMDAVLHQKVKKGDVLGMARVAGIMAAKQTWSLISMCHPLCIGKCTIGFETDVQKMEIRVISEVKVEEKTGVEMEAFAQITRRRQLPQVLEGMHAALAYPQIPLKINCVPWGFRDSM